MKKAKKYARRSANEAMRLTVVTCKNAGGGHPEWHIRADALELIKINWDLVIAHPPCTDLAVTGARWFAEKQKDGRQQKSIDFFMAFTKCKSKRVAIENPVSIMSRHYRKPDQIIQPYEYGHHARKATCLWLKGLPLLKPTNIVDPGEIDKYGLSVGASANYAVDENGKILSWNDPRTAKIRSRTYTGIAQAMAEQWGKEDLEAQTMMDI